MLSKSLLDELKIILRQEYKVEADDPQISEIASTLVGYFGLLSKIDSETNKSQSHLVKDVKLL